MGKPLTETRKRVFLEVLADSGSVPAAAQAATPWAEGSRGGSTTFYDERKRDPEFAVAWQRAEESATARVEAEIMRRAMEPSTRPVFSKGEHVGEQKIYDNKLLLAVARRLNPDAWVERRQIEHSGEVQHSHGHVVVSLEASDVLLLPEKQRGEFMAMLETIAAAKNPEPKAIEHGTD